tara:strand:+ start:69776 stop:70615 length:840 start_codon:yes stop_codon:yes gene_type:complete
VNNLRALIYRVIPKSWHKSLGGSKLLKPLRDSFFRTKTGYRELQVAVEKKYDSYEVVFEFVSSIQIATKAKERGIETKLLRNTLEVLKAYKFREKDDFNIADVGANFGFLSLVWAMSVCRQGKVYSFEPHPGIFKSFKKSIVLNNLGTIVCPNNFAVGKKEGFVDISLASTTSNTKKGEVTKGQLKAMATIEMVCLDDYFKNTDRLDLIKIDVDGIELQILQGASAILDRLRPIVVVETNGDTSICNFLQQKNYTLLDMSLNSFILEETLPLNVFCIPN